MHWKCYLPFILLLFLLGLWVAPVGGTAHAASGPPNPGQQGYQYAVQTDTGGSWDQMSSATAFGPTTAEAEGSFNVSSSYSASVGISVDVVNATVGFNVENGVTKGGACYLTPPDGIQGWVQLYATYKVVYFNIYWHNSITGVNTYQGNGSGKEFSSFQCESQVASVGGT